MVTQFSMPLVALFDDLLSISDIKNHEHSFVEKLKNHEFFPITLEELFRAEHPEWNEIPRGKKKKYNSMFKEFKDKLKYGKLTLCKFSGRAYVWQPFGSQQHPDFFVFDNLIYQALEAKSGKTQIHFNSGLPDDRNQIYIITTTKGTGAILAKQLYTMAVLNEFDEYEKEILEKNKNCNHNLNMLKNDGQNPYGLSYYNRRMINHSEPLVGENNKKDLEEARNHIRGLYEKNRR
jgi:hypothetical protein